MSDRPGCVCSVVGFECEDWRDSYYPEDCPKDWRIAYFMNDFAAVYLTDSDWFENDLLIEEVCEELEHGFELVMQCPPCLEPGIVEEIISQLEPLRGSIACLVVSVDVQPSAQLIQCLQMLAEHYPLNLDCALPVSEVLLEFAARFGAGFVWHGGAEEPILTSANYQVVKVPCADLRDLTALLKRLQHAGEDQARIGLFLESASNSAQRALELRTVVELMSMV